MHYAIVSETWPPEVNGVALTVQGLEQGLRARGHDVTMVRPRQGGEPDAHAGTLLVRGVALPRYAGLQFGLPATRRLVRLWSTARPDAVYVATEGPLGWSALGAARRLGISVATGFHTRFDAYMRDYGAAFLQQTALRWMRRFHNRSHVTLVPTHELAGFLQARGFANVVRLPRAVDTVQFDPRKRDRELRREWGLGDADFAAIHVGRIAPEKNLGLAVRAFRELQRMRPTARFVWIGDGPARQQLARDNPDFIFRGIQRGESLAAHFASGDLFVFPSHSETFGNVTLEAMASGVPTVAFDYGAAREHMRDGVHGAAIAHGDEAGFMAACVRIGNDDALRGAMGMASRVAVTGLRPEQVAADFDARIVASDSGWCLRANRVCARRGMRLYFAAVSRLGDGLFWYALMAAMVLLDGLDGLEASAHLAATGAVALLSYKLLKHWTRRPRPFASDVRIRAWIAPLDEFSFPSGHTLHAVAFTLVALAHYPMLAWLLIPFSASVAVSRVVLGLHYPSDVLAATMIGSALAAVSLWLVPGVSLFP